MTHDGEKYAVLPLIFSPTDETRLEWQAWFAQKIAIVFELPAAYFLEDGPRDRNAATSPLRSSTTESTPTTSRQTHEA